MPITEPEILEYLISLVESHRSDLTEAQNEALENHTATLDMSEHRHYIRDWEMTEQALKLIAGLRQRRGMVG